MAESAVQQKGTADGLEAVATLATEAERGGMTGGRTLSSSQESEKMLPRTFQEH
jgi:hypothetical protein